MRARIIPAVILAIILTSVACRRDKDSTAPDCQQLKTAIATGDKVAVREEIDELISRLPDRKHIRANLEALVASMNQQCQITTTTLCYACIYTLPAQSEISVKVNDNGTTLTRVLDISEDTNGNMIGGNMHE
jgi:hypothetical protein